MYVSIEALAATVHATAAEKAYTPVLEHIALYETNSEDGEMAAMTTDRYIISRYRPTGAYILNPSKPTALMHRDTALAIIKAKEPRVTIPEDGAAMVNLPGAGMKLAFSKHGTATMNYPLVQTFLTDAEENGPVETAEFGIYAERMDTISKLIKLYKRAAGLKTAPPVHLVFQGINKAAKVEITENWDMLLMPVLRSR